MVNQWANFEKHKLDIYPFGPFAFAPKAARPQPPLSLQQHQTRGMA